MVYKAYRSYCLAGTGDFPAEAVPVSQPFAPLLLLHPAAPGESRCLYPVASLAEVGQESTQALLPVPPEGGPLEDLLRKGGGAVLNPAYPRCWELLESLGAGPQNRPAGQPGGFGRCGKHRPHRSGPLGPGDRGNPDF